VNPDAFGIARFCSEYKTSEQRGQEGKSLREKVPRISQAEFEVAPDRSDPVKVIKKSSEGRLEHLIPIRYVRMSKSVFVYYRGTASFMAVDLAQTPTSNNRVQACGDCELFLDAIESGEIQAIIEVWGEFFSLITRTLCAGVRNKSIISFFQYFQDHPLNLR
jgi:hypothetical protein